MTKITGKRLLMIAHRGDTNSYKENTNEAFLSAFKKGADGIEMDIHLFNNEIVVVHDYLFDKDKNYPLLKEILPEIHDKGRIEIEIKSFKPDILKPLKKIWRNTLKLISN